MCLLIILLLPVLFRLFAPVSIWHEYVTGYTARLLPPLWLVTPWLQLEIGHGQSISAIEIGMCYQSGLDLCLLQCLDSLDLIEKVIGKMWIVQIKFRGVSWVNIVCRLYFFYFLMCCVCKPSRCEQHKKTEEIWPAFSNSYLTEHCSCHQWVKFWYTSLACFTFILLANIKHQLTFTSELHSFISCRHRLAINT